MDFVARGTVFFNRAVLATLIFAPMIAVAEEDFETNMEFEGLAIAIDPALPSSPRDKSRRLQGGWVQMSYVVTADGLAIDPIIMNSSGGVAFENQVRTVSESWRFEPSLTGAELPLNMTDTRFTIRGRGKGTTRRFARYAQHIMKNLHSDDIESARSIADDALELGGWNLYESTILWLMLGRIEGAEGDEVEKLEMYRRGLAVSDERSLQRDARIDLLEDIFALESKFGQFSAAMQTIAVLQKVPGSDAALERLSARIEEIETTLESDPEIVAHATVMNPCDCDEGTPLWNYVPARRLFSFANTSGNVERFEARCEGQRISGAVEADKTWTLNPEWGLCRIFVFGDDGATFDFLEHLQSAEGDATKTSAIASSHVLDRRSRSQ